MAVDAGGAGIGPGLGLGGLDGIFHVRHGGQAQGKRPVALAFVFQTACKHSLDFHTYSSTRSTAKSFRSRRASPSASYWSLTLCTQQPVYETRLPLPETG